MSLFHFSGPDTLIQTSLEGKPFVVTLSPRAMRALEQRSTPLVAEMELYFSCLTRLRVRFYEEDPEGSSTPVHPGLNIRFRPVVSHRCDLHEVEGKPPLVDAPLSKRFPFVPRWLRLDRRGAEWIGDFGHTRQEPAPAPSGA